MAIRIVRLGSKREPGEGLRIGTVRRPPRGIPKAEYGSRNFFDVWYPNLSPSEELLKMFFPVTDDRTWIKFKRRFLAEMKKPEPGRTLDVFASLSHQTSFSLGCYCSDEPRCHRSLLRELLTLRGASLI